VLNDLLLQEAPFLAVGLAWMGRSPGLEADGELRVSRCSRAFFGELVPLQAAQAKLRHCSLTPVAKEKQMPPPAATGS